MLLQVSVGSCALFLLLTFQAFCRAASVVATPQSATKLLNGEEVKECIVLPQNSMEAFEGFPLFVYCLELDYYDGEANATCEIWMGKDLVLNTTFLLDDDEEEIPYIPTSDMEVNTTMTYTVLTWNSTGACQMENVTFEVRPTPKHTCHESLQNGSVVEVRRQEGKSATLDCGDATVVLEHFNVTTRWLYNCNPHLPGGARVLKGDGQNLEEMSIDSVTFQHPGVYTCAATYRGRTIYKHYRMIVAERESFSKSTLKCTKSTYEVDGLGTNLTVSCEVNMGMGFTRNFHAFWKKDKPAIRDFVCVSAPGELERPRKPVNSSHRCWSSPIKRYYREPSERIGSTSQTIRLLLFLVNIQKEDLGLYTLDFEAHDKVEVNVTVKMNDAPTLERRLILFGVAIGTASMLLLTMLVLGFVFRLHIKVYWKMWFGPYEKDDKAYVVFLSYYFNTEQDAFAKQQTRALCAAVRAQLNRLNFKFYDEHFDGDRAENLIAEMERCHRVVILLTADYAKDHWKMFELQQGFKSMIESGSKIVFIMVPGIKCYIDQQAHTDGTYRMIQRAVEINRNISWTPKTTETSRSFALHLCYSLPKLRPCAAKKEEGSLLLSDTTSGEKSSEKQSVISVEGLGACI